MLRGRETHAEDSSTSTITDSIASEVFTDTSPKPWRREKECFMCSSPLGFSGIKRRGCRFCGHAVCVSCSPNKAKHPSSLRQERICSGCEAEILHSEMKSAPMEQKQIEELQKKLAVEIIGRQQAEARKQLAERKLEKKREQLKEVSEELENLRGTIVTQQKTSYAKTAVKEVKLERTASISVAGERSVGSRSQATLALTTVQVASIEADFSIESGSVAEVPSSTPHLPPPELADKHPHSFTHIPAPKQQDRNATHDPVHTELEECSRCKQYEVQVARLMERVKEVERQVLPSRRSQDIESQKNCQCEVF